MKNFEKKNFEKLLESAAFTAFEEDKDNIERIALLLTKRDVKNIQEEIKQEIAKDGFDLNDIKNVEIYIYTFDGRIEVVATLVTGKEARVTEYLSTKDLTKEEYQRFLKVKKELEEKYENAKKVRETKMKEVQNELKKIREEIKRVSTTLSELKKKEDEIIRKKIKIQEFRF